MTLAHLHEISVPEKVTSCLERRNAVPEGAPDFVRNVLGRIIAGKGESLPVSALPADGNISHKYSALGKKKHKFGGAGLGS